MYDIKKFYYQLNQELVEHYEHQRDRIKAIRNYDSGRITVSFVDGSKESWIYNTVTRKMELV